MKLYKMQVGGFKTKEIKNEYATTYNQVGDKREADQGTQRRVVVLGVLVIITLLLIRFEHNMIMTRLHQCVMLLECLSLQSFIAQSG